jgi:hypothetical protein
MGWDGFMKMERTKLRERSEGKLRRALGMALPGEAKEQLDRIGADDRRRAEQGLVSIKGEGGKISYKHIDDLSPKPPPPRSFGIVSSAVATGRPTARAVHDLSGSDAPRWSHQGVRLKAHRRGQEQARDHPLPEALHHQGGLPRADLSRRPFLAEGADGRGPHRH